MLIIIQMIYACIILAVYWWAVTHDPMYSFALLYPQERETIPVEYCVETSWTEVLEYVNPDLL